MKPSLTAALLLALAWTAGAQPATVQVKQAPLYAKPTSTSKFLGRIPLGTELVILERRSGWAQVRASNPSVSGWLREQTFTSKPLDAKAGAAAGGVTSTEVSLAGKAFSTEVEGEYRRKNPGLDFAVLDLMESYGLPDSELDRFLADGGLDPDGDRR